MPSQEAKQEIDLSQHLLEAISTLVTIATLRLAQSRLNSKGRARRVLSSHLKKTSKSLIIKEKSPSYT